MHTFLQLACISFIIMSCFPRWGWLERETRKPLKDNDLNDLSVWLTKKNNGKALQVLATKHSVSQ